MDKITVCGDQRSQDNAISDGRVCEGGLEETNSVDVASLGNANLGNFNPLSNTTDQFDVPGFASGHGRFNCVTLNHGMLMDENLDKQAQLQFRGDNTVPIYQLNPGSSLASKAMDSYDSVMFPDQENMVMENWAGTFNFKVTPVPSSRKAIYDSDLNKLFVTKNTPVPFKIELDFDKMSDLTQFSIRSSLLYLDYDLINEPVLRCYSHMGEDEHLADEDEKALIQHILRSSDTGQSRYTQQEVTKRCYLSFPVDSPEPGVNYITKSLHFKCLNSCATNPAVTVSTTRDLGLFFVLYGFLGGEFKLVGRRLINLRVCTFPAREHEIEQGHQQTRLRNEQTDEIDNQGQGKDMIESVPPVVQAQSSSVRVALTGPISTEDETVSPLQESTSSDLDSRLQFRKLIQDIQWVMQQKHSTNPALKDYANNVFGSLRLINGLCQSARRLESDAAAEEKDMNSDIAEQDTNGQD